jgi:hypothetical protein
MVRLPWRRGETDDGDGEDDGEVTHDDAIVVCAFQDGTIAVYEDRVVIERVKRSRFDDKTLAFESVVGVDYSEGITIGYLQVEEVGVEPDRGGLLSDPVNENTVHFGRADRGCAQRARDAITERAAGRP